MDLMTKLYKHRAEVLAEQVAHLEAQLKYLSEAEGQYQGNTPNQRAANPKYGRGTRSGVVGGGGTQQGSEEIDFTGGNVDPKTGAWSPSSGGPAVADTEAGDTEIKERMRKIARGGGLFEKGVEKTEQTAAYKEMAGELERRKAARAAKASGSKASAEGSAGAGTEKSAAGAGGVGAGRVGGTDSTAGAGKDRVPAPTPKVGVGGVRDRLPVSKPEERTVSPKPTGTEGGSDEGSGIDPKLVVLGLAGAGYAGAKAKEYYDRQREKGKGTEKPKTPEAKAQETKAPEAKAPEAKAPEAKARAGEVKGQPPELLAKPQEPAKVSGGQAKGQPPELLAKPQEPVKVGGGQGRVKAPESTIGGEPIQKGKPSVAERAAMGRDRLRAKMDASKAAEAEAKAAGEAAKAPKAVAEPPAYAAGSYSTPDGKVVTPGEGAGKAVAKGSQVNAKLKNFGKSAAKFALVDVPAMMVAGDVGEKGAKALGAGKEDAEIAGTVASFAPMAMSPVVSAAAVPGYVGGKLIEKGVEASGLGDLQRKGMQKAADAWTAEGRKGYKSQEDKVWNPQTGKYMTLAQSAEATKQQAKKERRTDVRQGFAGEAEAKEFAKQMQDPEFRKKHEREMQAAQVKELERQAGGSAIAARAMGAAPDWLGDVVDVGAKGVEAAEEGLGKAIGTAIDYTPGGKYVAGKVGEFFNWLNK